MREKPNCFTSDFGGFVRVKQLAELLGVSRSTIWRMEKAGILPKKIAITGARAVGWRVSDIREFVNSREQV